MIIVRTFCICLLLLYSFDVAAIDAQKYDARLCSAELVVLKGDLRQFLLKSTSEKHRDGYQQRIAGAIGTLNWLCRQYASVHNLDAKKLQAEINEFRVAIELKNFKQANQLLNGLTNQMPLSLKGLKPQEAKTKAIKIGKEIYRDYCQACHNIPNLNQARPAYSLFKMAKNLSEKEFIARMIVGVHGTPEIGLQNPLTNDDIAGMFIYLLKENN